MNQKPSRMFGVGDALIAIIAVGIVLALVRDQPYRSEEFRPVEWGLDYLQRPILVWIGAATPLLATATLAVLAVRLRSPRPDLRRLTRQPGTTACLAAAVVMGVDLAAILVEMFAAPLIGITNPRQDFLSLVTGEGLSYVYTVPYIGLGHPDTKQVGLAVAAAWSVQAIGRRWRPSSGWIDRLGRGIGIAWIVLMSVRWLVGE